MTGTWRVNDSKVLAAMQSEGALGPERRRVTVKVDGDLGLASEKLQVKASRLFYEGYDAARLVLYLRRCDDFSEK